MNKIYLRRINRIEMLKCRRIYLKSFPANERAPFWRLFIKAGRDNTDFWGIYRDNTLIGFFYVVSDNDTAHILYFAIAEKERGKGFGSAALQALKREYSSMHLFLASEEIDPDAPNLDEQSFDSPHNIGESFGREPPEKQRAYTCRAAKNDRHRKYGQIISDKKQKKTL